MWLLYALLSAVTAALVAIFGKIGLGGVNPMLATAVRAVIMALVTVIFAFSLGKFRGFALLTLSGGEWLWIILAGLAGALSWIFYFYALQMGQATSVAAIDRLSIVFVFILAIILLGEKFSWQAGIGALFVVLGAILMTWK